MTVHELKTDPDIYDLECMGPKTFMFRKNDRDYQVGDVIISKKTEFSGVEMAEGSPLIYTGDFMVVVITYILHGPFYTLPEGSCIISFDECYTHFANTQEDER